MKTPGFLALVLLVSNFAGAQEAGPSDRQTIQELVREVKELQERVKFLESQHPLLPNPNQRPSQP